MNLTQRSILAAGRSPMVYADPYSGRDDAELLTRRCERCGGSGILEAYVRVNGGVCYQCDGIRPVWTETVGEARRRERSRVNSANRRLLRAIKAEARVNSARDAFDEANPGLGEKLGRVADARPASFATELRAKLERYGSLSEKQVAVAVKIIAEYEARVATEEARRASAEPVPTGVAEVSGTVLSAKWVESGPAWRPSLSLKVTILDDRGFKVYGTLPSRIHEAAASGSTNVPANYVGAVVAFTATLKPSSEDPTFGFATRPSKARVLSRAE